MTPTELLKEIGANRYRPIYYFYGEEDFRKAEAVKYILHHYIPQQQRLLNYIKLAADKADFGMLCAEVAAIPMIGERRCILIEEIQRLNAAQQKQLFSLLKDLPPNMVVILVSPAAHTPKRKSAFLREVAKIAQVVRFNRLTETGARKRIERHLEAAGFTYDREAVDLLNSLTGGDFGGLDGELEKLSLSAEAGSHIGVAEVKKLTSSHEEFSVFELIDLIAERKTERALYVCHDLLEQGTNPVTILRLLSGHMLNLIRIHNGKNVAGHPMVVERLQQQARAFEEPKVIGAIVGIARAEREIRRSKVSRSILLENLIREISR